MKKLYWFTGQAGAGKTVLANELKKHFDKLGDKKCVIIDGDDIREIYKNTDYSIDGRKANVDFVQKLCSFLNLPIPNTPFPRANVAPDKQGFIQGFYHRITNKLKILVKTS